MSALHGLLSRIKDAGAAFRDRGTFQTPDAFTGLLSPEEQASARSRGLLAMGAGILNGQGNALQAISQGVLGGQGAYDSAIGQTLQQHDYLQQKSDEQIAREQQQKILRARAQIAQQFPIPENASESQRASILQQMMIAYAKAGDTEMAGKIGEVVKSLGRDPSTTKDQNEWVDFGGYKELRDKLSGKVLERVQKTPSPRDPNTPSSGQIINDQRMFTREEQLADDFRAQTKPYADIASNFSTVASLSAAAEQGNPQAQIGLVFAFMKGLDPGSVVREGEYATAKNAAGVPERIRNQYNKLLGGTFLSSDQVRSMVDQSQSIADGWRKRLQPIRESYNARAKRWHVDGSLITPDYFDFIDEYNKTKKKAVAPANKNYRKDNPFAGN